jgi:hypothetical protein
MRPICINGIPQYIFVNNDEKRVQYTTPLLSVYQPIIVSKERYDQLVSQNLIEDSVITVHVDCSYRGITGVKEFNAYDLDITERDLYKAKIPLSNRDFKYPISLVEIEVVNSLNRDNAIKTIELDPNDYTIVGGTLYFYRNLEEMAFESEKDLSRRWTLSLGALNYNVNVYFSTIIPNEECTSDIIDVSSGDISRIALSQAIYYSIADYFNQYHVAATNAKNKAEL